MADVQGAGRVGRDELDLHALALRGPRAAELRTVGEHAVHDGRARLRREPRIDEAGARHFQRRKGRARRQLALHRVQQLLGDLARLALERTRELHGNVAGIVAVLRVARALELDLDARGVRRELRKAFAQDALEQGFRVVGRWHRGRRRIIEAIA